MRLLLIVFTRPEKALKTLSAGGLLDAPPTPAPRRPHKRGVRVMWIHNRNVLSKHDPSAVSEALSRVARLFQCPRPRRKQAHRPCPTARLSRRTEGKNHGLRHHRRTHATVGRVAQDGEVLACGSVLLSAAAAPTSHRRMVRYIVSSYFPEARLLRSCTCPRPITRRRETWYQES